MKKTDRKPTATKKRTATKRPVASKHQRAANTATNPIAVSLQALAKALGHDARLDSINAGDRGYYQREKLDLVELYTNYWDANYRQLWYSAFYSLSDALRTELIDVARSAHNSYLTATRSAAGTKAYVAQLPPGGDSSISTRLAALRFFNGRSERKLERRDITSLAAGDKLR